MSKCQYCDKEAALQPACTKRQWKVCKEHLMIECPVCGHKACWMEGMMNGDYYVCLSLTCNWTSNRSFRVGEK